MVFFMFDYIDDVIIFFIETIEKIHNEGSLPHRGINIGEKFGKRFQLLDVLLDGVVSNFGGVYLIV